MKSDETIIFNNEIVIHVYRLKFLLLHFRRCKRLMQRKRKFGWNFKENEHRMLLSYGGSENYEYQKFDKMNTLVGFTFNKKIGEKFIEYCRIIKFSLVYFCQNHLKLLDRRGKFTDLTFKMTPKRKNFEGKYYLYKAIVNKI